MLTTLGAVAAGLLAVLGIIALAARHSRRTWTDDQFEEARSGGTALGNAFLTTQAILDPGAQHALEQRTAEPAETIESEGPPIPGEDH